MNSRIEQMRHEVSSKSAIDPSQDEQSAAGVKALPKLSRRDFLRVSATTLMVTALANNPVSATTALAQDRVADLSILNYLLTVEHLMVAAYKRANGTGLLSGRAQDYFIDFGAQEEAHVVALVNQISQLGGAPIRAQETYTFPTFRSQQEVLEFFLQLEELSAAAYLGQIGSIEDQASLATLASIHNVEAQQAAVINDMIGRMLTTAFGRSEGMAQTLDLIDPYVNSTPTEMPNTGLGGHSVIPTLWVPKVPRL